MLTVITRKMDIYEVGCHIDTAIKEGELENETSSI